MGRYERGGRRMDWVWWVVGLALIWFLFFRST
jgi:hypothetical protein